MITKEQALAHEKLEAGPSVKTELVSCWENHEAGILVLVTDQAWIDIPDISPNHITRRYVVYGRDGSRGGGILEHYDREDS